MRDLVEGLDEVAGLDLERPGRRQPPGQEAEHHGEDTALPASRATSTRRNRSEEATITVTSRAARPRNQPTAWSRWPPKR